MEFLLCVGFFSIFLLLKGFLSHNTLWLWFPLPKLLPDTSPTHFSSRTKPFLSLSLENKHLKHNNELKQKWTNQNRTKQTEVKKNQGKSTRNIYRYRDSHISHAEKFHKNTKPETITYTQRTCKGLNNKQTKGPDKQLWDKKNSKNGTWFVLLGMEAAPKSGLYTQWDSIEEA